MPLEKALLIRRELQKELVGWFHNLKNILSQFYGVLTVSSICSKAKSLQQDADCVPNISG
jgi:hypothetical protein